MKLGRYEILEELGRGGFGIVYRARDSVLGRLVALKVLHSQLTVDPGFIGRFEQEARLAAQLDHPNLVPVHDLGQEDGRYFIAMGLMAGGSLKDRLKGGALPEEQVHDVLPQILRGLEVIHGNGIIHRDLKPGNILFDQYEIARISDLGFAKALHADSSVSLSMTGGMIGTPAYMAPEIWRGKPASPQSDIYSLGCIIHEMLTGQTLFEGETPAESMTKHLVDRPQYKHTLPEGWHELLDKCLAMDPNDRYPCVQAISEAYDKLLSDSGSEQEAELHNEIEKTPLRERLQSLIGGRESPTVKKKAAEDDSHQVEAPGEQAPIIEEDGQVPEAATQQIAQTADEKRTEELQALPEKKDDRKWMLFASLGILAISLIVLSFSLLKGRNRYAPVPVANETPTRTATQKPTETPTKPPSKTPTRTPDLSFGIGSIMTRETDGMEMVFVPAGEFEMGGNDADAWDDEKPAHTVYLDSYWIDKYEVSNAQYAKCVAAGDCTKPSYTKSYTRSNYYGNPEYDDYPVIYVNWNQARAYCQWAGGDLPTEAQWEKAARGTDGRTYPWGNQSPTSSLANYAWNTGDTSPVTDYEAGASPYGALNMAGNVREWVNDWYGSNYYSTSPTRNPSGPSSGEYRVLRGGSWYYNRRGDIRAAYRVNVDPAGTYNGRGFRCVLPQP